MSKTIYRFTRILAFFISLIIFIYMVTNGEIKKSIMNLILLFAFEYTSLVFQKKVNIITPSYVFIFFILYIVNSVCSCYFSFDKILELDKTGFLGWGKEDFFELYFYGVLIAYILIIIYLHFFCKKEIYENRKPNPINCNAIYVSTVVCLTVNLFLNSMDILIPIFVLWLMMLFFNKKRRLVHLLVIVAFALIYNDFVWSRYQFVQLALPLILIYLIVSNKNYRYFSLNKIFIIFIFSIILIGLYGTISEILKLNLAYGMNYDIKTVLFSYDTLKKFFINQFYRVFIIWIKLGGYIIYDTKLSGYHYGLTYVKSFSSLFGFEYISLPKISATYNYSSYAQPGLFAEGYANFGIFGASINIILVFILMEITRKNYYRKRDVTSLALMTIPFSKILVDGGSLNSALILMIPIFIVVFFSYLFNSKKRSEIYYGEERKISIDYSSDLQC